MSNVALLDLVRPFIVRGENFGGMHAALAVLRVVEYEVSTDANATVVRGRCEFNGALRFDNANGLSIGADETAPVFDPNERKSVFDIRETSVAFELVAPRVGSAVIAQGVAGLGTGAAAGPLKAVLDALAQPAPGASPNAYPATGFTLDLLLDAPRLRPPFLRPARLSELGTLAPDPTRTDVSFTLPRLRFRISHGQPGLGIQLVSAGAASLDDPGDIGVAELISMDPPYAFFGTDSDSRAWGMAFRSIVLDLSGDTTPAALREKTGVGDDWTGLYLPDARVFFSPTGERGLAFDIGARELLIGIGDSPGLWGDFEAALIQQGADNLALSARFADPAGKLYAIEKTGEFTAKARIPAQTRMLVDVTGGRPPYTVTSTVGSAAQASGRVFVVDFAAEDSLQIAVQASSTGTDGVRTRTLTITAERVAETPKLATPGPEQPTAGEIVPAAPTGAVPILVERRGKDEIVLRTGNDTPVHWSVDGGAETGLQRTLTVPVAAGGNHNVQARKPGTPDTRLEPFYYTYKQPAAATSTPDVQTTKARGADGPSRLPGGNDSLAANKAALNAIPASPKATIKITGYASKEGDARLVYNYNLAARRAAATRDAIQRQYPGKFDIRIYPDVVLDPGQELDRAQAWDTATGWSTQAAQDSAKWSVDVTLPGTASPELIGAIAISRPATPPPPDKPPPDPQPEAPAAPSWFRSASLKLRVVASDIIAGEAVLEVDIETLSEEKLRNSGQLPAGAQAPTGKALVNGSAVGPENPADGITKFRVLVQSDPGTGKLITLIAAGADPGDKDGLYLFGWMPGEPGAPTEQNPASPKDFGRTLLGSYLTFWPLLAAFPVDEAVGGVADGQATPGDIVDVVAAGALLATPGVIAALPWFQVERVVWYGAEFEGAWRRAADTVFFDGRLLVDIEADWSADFLGLVKISTQSPLKVRYKAIGLRFGNVEDDGSEQFVFRPVFDSGRGYTIDLASGGSVKLIDPLGQILKILGARLSKSNPLTFEIEIGLGVDLGVVRVDRAGLRVYLDEPRPPELTALAATVDIPGALIGSGYIKIGKSTDPQGHEISVIAGQIDMTLRTISLRVSAALAIASIPAEAGGPATGVYVGLDVILPVGLPLGSSGLGIFGFRGIFGMHYMRNPAIGAGSNVPSLAWLEAAGGRPNLLANGAVELWTPAIDRWAFGLGLLIGTMEGGYLINLDGTFLLELPGPRVIIMLNARLLSPPPSMDELGMGGGILSVIEITPEHFLIGLIVEWAVEDLVSIRIPVEAVFPFGAAKDRWHLYLGARKDVGQPATVDVLGIIQGTGYLMFKGDGLPAYPVHQATLPEIRGFAIGLGVAASFTWGDVDDGLYLTVGGGMDAVVGFDPFILAGTIWVVGELRLWIVSIGADAQLTAKVQEQANGDLEFSAYGEACGHVDFFFFDVSGCVEIKINADPPAAAMPDLVEKVSIKSRSPALLHGTGVDRGIDVSLGEAVAGAATPALDHPDLPVVPIDAIPVISMTVPPVTPPGLTVSGLPAAPIGATPGLMGAPDVGYGERGGERYRYDLSEVRLERIDPATGSPILPAVSGTLAPTVWWSTQPDTEPAPAVQLALFTWDPSPATKAIEKTEHLVEEITERWGTVCAPVAAPAEVLWTFRFEELGTSPSGWALDGIAWPDETGSVRTAAAETRITVSERWRSGDHPLDNLRGIVPAIVVGAQVPCRRKQSPRGDHDDLVFESPLVVVGGRGPIDPTRPSGQRLQAHDPAFDRLLRGSALESIRISPRLADKVQRSLALEQELLASVSQAAADSLGALLLKANAGEPSGRTALAAALSALHPEAKDIGRLAYRCVGKVLQAPVLDDGRVIVLGDPQQEKEVAHRLEALGLKHGELDDVVVLHTAGFTHLDLLVLVHRKFPGRWPIVRVVGPGDSTLDQFPLDLSHLVGTAADLPPKWTDPASPWTDDVADTLAYGRATGLAPLHVQLPAYKDAVAVEIGRRPGRFEEDLTPAYWVAAFSAVSMAEVIRHDWDQAQHQGDRSILTNLLGPAATDNVLLVPDSLYRLTVASHGVRKGDGATRGSSTEPVQQSYWFRTDRIADGPAPAAPHAPAEPLAQDDMPALHFASKPPASVRLDSWLLLTLPAEGETHVFTEPTLKLVFNTADVERIFKAYGKRLQVRIEAASGRHPRETDNGTGFPLQITPDLLTPVQASVLSPYEDALLDAAGLIDQHSNFCISIDETRVRHQELDIPIHLERATGYLLDVEVVPDGAAEGTRGPRIFRRQFATGMFAGVDQLATSLTGVAESGRGGAPGAIAAIAARFAGHAPAGAEFDDAWRAAGFEPLGAVRQARISVIWEQATASSPPQPTGLLVEASAPLVRSRPYPVKVEDTSVVPAATRWALQEQTWLEVQDGSAAGVVHSIIRSPGADRFLVVLAPGQRGARVVLDLVEKAFPGLPFLNQNEQRVHIVDALLAHAPWEER